MTRDKGYNRKLDAAQAIEIYRRSNNGEPCAELAREFGVSLNLVYEIRRGETWSSVTSAIGKP